MASGAMRFKALIMSVKVPNPSSVIDSLKKTVRFLRDPKVRLMLALATLAMSIYLALAFISYLWTWDVDQSKLGLTAQEFMDTETLEVDNWAGHQGASLADLFIHQWFGLSAFGLVFLLFVLSFRIIKLRVLPIHNSLKYTIIGLIWGSISLSYLFGDSAFYLGGVHGYVVNNWLNAFLGKVGTGFILALTLFGIILFAFENSFSWLALYWAKYTNPEQYVSLKTDYDQKTALSKPKKIKPTVVPQEEPEEEPLFDDPTLEQTEMDKQADSEVDTTSASPSKKMRPNFYTEAASRQANAPVVEKDEFILHDDGVKESLLPKPDDGLGFEVDVPDQEELVDIPPSSLDTPKTEFVLDESTDYDEAYFSATDEDTDFNHAPDEKQQEEHASTDSETTSSVNVALRVEKSNDIMADDFTTRPGDYDPTLDLPNFRFPPIDILVDHKIANSEVTNEELLENKNNIVETLRNFKIEIEKIKAVVGPTVTLYEIIPAPGVRISKIKNLEDDIALSLSALGIRIIAPMPGRGTIGIEVPNQKPKIVSMRSVIASEKFQKNKFELPIALGKNISNETYVADLAKMPHLLVAGATGQGKSVGINVILTSLLYKKHPAQLKFVLIDPKKVELNIYDIIKNHYLAQLPGAAEPIITDNQLVVNTLNSLNIEMDNRYQLLKDAQVRNIKEYNAKFISRQLNPLKGHEFLPYIVLVIDEFADLIMTAGKEVELPIARLAQLARAIGIHLIVATQRPSTNIITGVIKANFPARLAFKVASMIDSRTILDSPGANQLIGRGDMLITDGGNLLRLQCAFIDTPEVEAMATFIGSQRGYFEPHMLPEVPTDGDDESRDMDLSKRDELFDDAARMIVLHQQGSTSLIQRKLSIGYNRAGRIIDQLEAAGIVGAFEGSKARQVHYTDEYSLEQYLTKLNEQFQ